MLREGIRRGYLSVEEVKWHFPGAGTAVERPQVEATGFV
jgi:hypothetical protein